MTPPPDHLALPAVPTRVADLERWGESNGFSRENARRRFAQGAIAAGIALVPELRQSIVFKGGNALDFVLSINRTTVDLDFSLDQTTTMVAAQAPEIERLLCDACERAGRLRDLMLVVHRVRQQPPGADRTFVTFTTRIG